MQTSEIALTVNGHVRRLKLDPRTSLLDALRETLDLTGTKKGCNQGACGACTILLNGKRVATAIAATVPDPKVFRSGRDFAAWIGIVPRQDSTGGKQKLGPISKQGDQYLRRILVVGAHAVLKRARHQPEKYPWVTRLLERKPFRVVAVAVANKMARVAWALLARGGSYRAPALAAAA